MSSICLTCIMQFTIPSVTEMLPRVTKKYFDACTSLRERNILCFFFYGWLICTLRMGSILKVFPKVTNVACSKFSIRVSIPHFVYSYESTYKVTFNFLMGHCPLNLLYCIQKSFKRILKLQILFKDSKQFKLIFTIVSICYGTL